MSELSELSGYDPEDITLAITTDEGTSVVTIPFDFEDFTDEETRRVAALIDGETDVSKTLSAFFFVAVCRQVHLTDAAFAGFRSEMQRLWDHDPSIMEIV